MLLLLGAIALLQIQPQDVRLAKAYRYEKAGWVYAHLEGKPRTVGFQYGYLLAPEIDDAHKALKATDLGEKDWNWYREEAKKLFWEKLDQEYREELQGMTEGLTAKGIKVDVWDVLAFNAHIELGGYYLPWQKAQRGGQRESGAKESCSAFVATGSMTKDGKIVMGHNLWWGYIIGQRFNVMLDIKPAKGNRILMDALAGMIHSGSDFAINSAGLMLCETTISGFHGFDPNGLPEFMRMRKSIQYANNLDEMVSIFKIGNNGGYANTWLMGDAKTGEIGKLELGLKNVIFNRTKDGAYVGANYPEDPKLIKEEVTWFNPNPAQNGCMARKQRWGTLMAQNKGQIDAAKAQQFLGDTFNEVTGKQGASDATLCGRSDIYGALHGATNARVATSDSVMKMSIWARMGIPDGSELIAADYFKKYPNQRAVSGPWLKDIKAQPWVTFTVPR
ncbi:MAG: peptidase C45 [Chlorobia bacterium]|nr:peptidase C45 [Fimbriimonadaceae bacterium]